MGCVLAEFRVEDVERFWSAFSERGRRQRARHGSKGARVFRIEEDPWRVVVLFDWDRHDVELYLQNPEARETLRSAGALGGPRLAYLEELGELES